MKVKYIKESCVSLTNNKIYDVISIESGWYRIVDDTDEDYLFMPEDFEMYKIPRNEIDLTKKHLESYQKQLIQYWERENI